MKKKKKKKLGLKQLSEVILEIADSVPPPKKIDEDSCNWSIHMAIEKEIKRKSSLMFDLGVAFEYLPDIIDGCLEKLAITSTKEDIDVILKKCYLNNGHRMTVDQFIKVFNKWANK